MAPYVDACNKFCDTVTWNKKIYILINEFENNRANMNECLFKFVFVVLTFLYNNVQVKDIDVSESTYNFIALNWTYLKRGRKWISLSND